LIFFLLVKVVKTDRIGRSNREPDLHPVRLEQKTVPQTNREKNARTGLKSEKTDNPSGWTGSLVWIFF
jgi:hypothetical protein